MFCSFDKCMKIKYISIRNDEGFWMFFSICFWELGFGSGRI